MESGGSLFDIVLLAVVAAFLVLRLRGVLGRRTGHEKPPANVITGATSADSDGPDDDTVVRIPDRERSPGQEGQGAAPDGPPALSRLLREDPGFTQQDFLNGARMAFEMVVDAFARGDKDTLRPLLSREVFGNFTGAIDARDRTGEVEETTLVGIKSATITDSTMEGRMAYLTVTFVSEEVRVVRDRDGAVVSGDPNRVIEVTDVWTFGRNIRAADPNWQLVATESPE